MDCRGKEKVTTFGLTVNRFFDDLLGLEVPPDVQPGDAPLSRPICAPRQYWDRGRLARLSAKRAQTFLLEPIAGVARVDLGNPRS